MLARWKNWVFPFATKDPWAALSVLVGIGTNICDAQETKERLGGGAAGALSLARTAGTLTPPPPAVGASSWGGSSPLPSSWHKPLGGGQTPPQQLQYL